VSDIPLDYEDEPEEEEPEPDRADVSQWFTGQWRFTSSKVTTASRTGTSRLRNGEIIFDSAEGYRHKGYAVTMAENLNPNAELVIDEAPG
jgi:hypothetical protein